MDEKTYPDEITYNRNALGVQTSKETILVVQSRYRKDGDHWRDIQDFPQQHYPPITDIDRGLQKGFKTLDQAIEAIEISKSIRALLRPRAKWNEDMSVAEFVAATWEYRVIERTTTTHNEENTLFEETPLVTPE
jgi:hypothetical protein